MYDIVLLGFFGLYGLVVSLENETFRYVSLERNVKRDFFLRGTNET
jgi:hypothetical protein